MAVPKIFGNLLGINRRRVLFLLELHDLYKRERNILYLVIAKVKRKIVHSARVYLIIDESDFKV